MGPPPPPPPPPSLSTPTVLSSGQRKTTNAPRRDNNPVPPPSQCSRPRVDPTALQHAAARLRKTGYNEQIRGDVPNLSDGRVDGANQQLPDRDRAYGSQQHQLARHPPGEQVYAAPSYPDNAGSQRDIRRPANSLNTSSPSPASTYIQPQITTPAPVSTSVPLDTFDSTPKSLFQTFNKPSSNSFIDKTLQDPQSYSYTTSSSYSSSSVSTVPNSASPNSRPWTDRTVPQVTRSSFSSVSSTAQPPSASPPPIRSSPPSLNPPSSQTRSYSPQNRTTTVEWTSPYTPGQPNVISDPRSLIRDFATNTYVKEEQPTYRTPSPLARQPSPSGRQQTVVSRHDQFTRQLRDDGLTVSQRAANQLRNPLQRHELPSEVASRLYQGSYRGDEVDQLVQKMSTHMRTNVMQSSNICVACHSEISADKPGCTALDQIFHVACFKCCRCSKVLAGSSFYNIENDPICEGCYQNTLEKCTKCGQTIADKLLRACGGTFHVDCFTCYNCNKTLDGIPFTVDSENNVHCVPCFHDKFAPRCAVCSKGIVPNEGEKESVRVVAMNKSFHVECYKCEDCGLQLSSKVEGQGCYPLDSHLYCKTCNSNRLRMASVA